MRYTYPNHFPKEFPFIDRKMWEKKVMEPVEKDRMIDLLQTRIERQNERIARLEQALLKWVEFWKADNDEGENDPLLAEEAMEETRILLGDDI